uniref:Reverse transcriptase domain-containing protein n=1 Tax=Cannabis sativa TaxID=3483 RepID=A0A803PJ10_CANSA
MVAFEIMHYMKRKTAGRNGVMALKLDMSKAYDRVEWGYLQAVLTKMGFDNHTTSLLMSCVTSARYQIAHAGRLFGSITPGRGLRQGDPLSSYLFIICTEGFSALLKHYEHRQPSRGIQIARGAPTVSHMFFVDDSYIFCRANEREASNVQSLLNVFEPPEYNRPEKVSNPGVFERESAEAYLVLGWETFVKGGWQPKSCVEKHYGSSTTAQKRSCIRVGFGASVNILNDPWSPDISDPYVHTVSDSLLDKKLQTKHVVVNAMCPFCNLKNETINHILVTCSFSRACWTKLEPGISTDVAGTFPSWLNLIFENWSGRSRQLVAMLCWALWKSRNELVWNQKNVEVKDVVVLAQMVLNQWLYAQDKNFDPSLGLLFPEDGNEHWTLPNIDTIKINTDAAIFSSTNCYSYSCVARTHNGTLLQAKAKCVRGVVSPEVAKALGIHEALNWIKDKQWSRVEVESDCLVAIQSIRSSSTMFSYFGRIITKCKKLLDESKDCFVSLKFVKRSANNGAHYLARFTCSIADRSLSVSNMLPRSLFLY